MEKEIDMSQRMRGMWVHAKTPKEYHKFFLSEFPSGIVDEVHVARFFNTYLSKQQKTIVDLGIGTGRELVWIDKLKNLSQVIGLDYSSSMIKFCAGSASLYRHELICIRDNLLGLKHLPGLVKKVKEPVIYISLINSLGNFSKSERIQTLRQLRPFLKSSDRIVLCLYKRPTLRMKKFLFPSFFPKFAKPKSKTNATYLSFVREYALIPHVWHSVIGRGGVPPRFWYNRDTNDIVIHINGKRMVISHRFNKKEIHELTKSAKFSVEKFITGKFMYIVVLKRIGRS